MLVFGAFSFAQAQTDPFAVHVALLSRITDKNIHDVVAYLETLE